MAVAAFNFLLLVSVAMTPAAAFSHGFQSTSEVFAKKVVHTLSRNK